MQGFREKESFLAKKNQSRPPQGRCRSSDSEIDLVFAFHAGAGDHRRPARPRSGLRSRQPGVSAALPGRSLVGRPVREALPELEGQGSLQRLERVFQTGQPYTSRETRLMLDRETFFNVTYQPMYS